MNSQPTEELYFLHHLKVNDETKSRTEDYTLIFGIDGAKRTLRCDVYLTADLNIDSGRVTVIPFRWSTVTQGRVIREVSELESFATFLFGLNIVLPDHERKRLQDEFSKTYPELPGENEEFSDSGSERIR